MSLTNALRIGTAGLNVSQVGLSTVSHNVVNANTEGFSRQSLQTTAVANNGFGNGVQMGSIQRVSDRFLNERVYAARSDLEFSDTRKSYLDTLEGVVTNASATGGMEALARGVFESYSNLSNDPANSALKRNVVQQSQLFSQTVRDVYDDLTTTAADADNAITSEISTINQLLRDISNLSGQISAVTNGSASGANANDLLDARGTKINELAKRLKLQVNENATSGGLRVTLENGRRLVDESGYVQLKRTSGTGTYQDIGLQAVQVDGSLSSTTLPIDPTSLTSGKIKALVDIRDSVVTNLKSQVDSFANALRTEVNKISSRGTSYPPVRTLTSGSTAAAGGVATDLYSTTGYTSLVGNTFNISVTNSLGQPVLTTQGGTPLTLPGAGPFSLTDLATLINTNATIGNTTLGGTNGVTATATTDGSGNPYLQIQAANASYRVVLSNVSGDPLGILGMNNVFTGTGAADLNVASSIVANPELLPVARMRTTDGGVSSLDNQNILAMAAFADTKVGFSAVGGLGAQTTTLSGYAGQIVSNLSITISDAKDRQTFADNISNQLEQLKSSATGVNVNEELSQMLVYQNSFQASARLISVVNDLLAELVNIVR